MSTDDKPYRCISPVAFLIFNRPDTTQRVFAEIAKARPHKLLVVADGPRQGRPEDADRCAQVRNIINGVDWDCEVLTNYSDDNLGCARRIASGIDWVFANVEEAIFLEDDCLPHPSFFRFCDELLKRFRHNDAIMSIGGANFQFGAKISNYSYYFSRYIHVWGWASWRRAWSFYDAGMTRWPELKASRWLESFMDDKRDIRYWQDTFDQTYKGKTGTWDYQWLFACWQQYGLSVIPGVNLISNIGFGSEATHTGNEGGKLAAMETEEMVFPLSDPPFVLANSDADNKTTQLFFRPSRLWRVRRRFRQLLG